MSGAAILLSVDHQQKYPSLKWRDTLSTGSWC